MKILFKTVILVLFAVVIPAAQAGPEDTCIGLIEDVSDVLNWHPGICFINNDNPQNPVPVGTLIKHKNGERSCGSLNKKLDGAIVKLNQGKFEDAGDKLKNFQSRLDSLFNRGNPIIDVDKWAALDSPLGLAKSCVADL